MSKVVHPPDRNLGYLDRVQLGWPVRCKDVDLKPVFGKPVYDSAGMRRCAADVHTHFMQRRGRAKVEHGGWSSRGRPRQLVWSGGDVSSPLVGPVAQP